MKKMTEPKSSFQFSIQTLYEIGFMFLPYVLPSAIRKHTINCVKFRSGFSFKRFTPFCESDGNSDLDANKCIPLLCTGLIPFLDSPVLSMDEQLSLPSQLASFICVYGPLFPKNHIMDKVPPILKCPTTSRSSKSFTSYVYDAHRQDQRDYNRDGLPRRFKKGEEADFWEHEKIRGPRIATGKLFLSEQTKAHHLAKHRVFGPLLAGLYAWSRDESKQDPLAKAEIKSLGLKAPEEKSRLRRAAKKKHTNRTNHGATGRKRGRPPRSYTDDLKQMDADASELQRRVERPIQEEDQDAGEETEIDESTRRFAIGKVPASYRYCFFRIRPPTPPPPENQQLFTAEHALYPTEHPHRLLRAWLQYVEPPRLLVTSADDEQEPPKPYIASSMDATHVQSDCIGQLTAFVADLLVEGGNSPSAHTSMGWPPVLQRRHDQDKDALARVKLHGGLQGPWLAYAYYRILYEMQDSEFQRRFPAFKESAIWLVIFRCHARGIAWPSAGQLRTFFKAVIAGFEKFHQLMENAVSEALAEISFDPRQGDAESSAQPATESSTDLTAMREAGLQISRVSASSAASTSAKLPRKKYGQARTWVQTYLPEPRANQHSETSHAYQHSTHLRFIDAMNDLIRQLAIRPGACVWLHEALRARWQARPVTGPSFDESLLDGEFLSLVVKTVINGSQASPDASGSPQIYCGSDAWEKDHVVLAIQSSHRVHVNYPSLWRKEPIELKRHAAVDKWLQVKKVREDDGIDPEAPFAEDTQVPVGEPVICPLDRSGGKPYRAPDPLCFQSQPVEAGSYYQIRKDEALTIIRNAVLSYIVQPFAFFVSYVIRFPTKQYRPPAGAGRSLPAQNRSLALIPRPAAIKAVEHVFGNVVQQIASLGRIERHRIMVSARDLADAGPGAYSDFDAFRTAALQHISMRAALESFYTSDKGQHSIFQEEYLQLTTYYGPYGFDQLARQINITGDHRQTLEEFRELMIKTKLRVENALLNEKLDDAGQLLHNVWTYQLRILPDDGAPTDPTQIIPVGDPFKFEHYLCPVRELTPPQRLAMAFACHLYPRDGPLGVPVTCHKLANSPQRLHQMWFELLKRYAPEEVRSGSMKAWEFIPDPVYRGRKMAIWGINKLDWQTELFLACSNLTVPEFIEQLRANGCCRIIPRAAQNAPLADDPVRNALYAPPRIEPPPPPPPPPVPTPVSAGKRKREAAPAPARPAPNRRPRPKPTPPPQAPQLSLSVEEMDSSLLVPVTLPSAAPPQGAADTPLMPPDQLAAAVAQHVQFSGIYFGYPQHHHNDLLVGQPPCTPIPLLSDEPPEPSFLDPHDSLDFSTLPQMQPN
jgi:hypothetical protein